MHRTAVEYAGGQKENAPVTVVVTVVVVWESLVGGYMGGRESYMRGRLGGAICDSGASGGELYGRKVRSYMGGRVVGTESYMGGRARQIRTTSLPQLRTKNVPFPVQIFTTV